MMCYVHQSQNRSVPNQQKQKGTPTGTETLKAVSCASSSHLKLNLSSRSVMSYK